MCDCKVKRFYKCVLFRLIFLRTQEITNFREKSVGVKLVLTGETALESATS
jgi:hypothetical protein